MHTLSKLQKQQVGLRLPKYLIERVDELSQEYGLNRTDIITESIRSYIAQQEVEEFSNSFDRSCKELQSAIKNGEELQSLDQLIDEL